MLVGVAKEIKDHEYRVGLIPSTVRELVSKGPRVFVETGAGHGAGIGDDDYVAAGAEIGANADQVFDSAELIVKVKEPLTEERKKLKTRPDPFHLFAPGSRSSPDGGADRLRRFGNRL